MTKNIQIFAALTIPLAISYSPIMTSKDHGSVRDAESDPFGRRYKMLRHKRLQLLGASIRFESNSPALLRLVDSAYQGLPAHRLSTKAPQLRIRLLRSSRDLPHRVSEAAPLAMFENAGCLGATTDSSNLVVLSPKERSGLVRVSAGMSQFPYHARYELIEFAVFTLASAVQGLVPLHAACVGSNGAGILLMGASGAGKSTLAMQCLLHGLEFVSEDSVFVHPEKMLATGVANFLHLGSDSLRWLEGSPTAAAVRRSPIIRRRSGARKFELDLRGGRFRLAKTPLKIIGIAFLSPEKAGANSLVTPLSKADLRRRLAAEQPFGAAQPEWRRFSSNASALLGFELRRGRHPLEAVEALRTLLGTGT